MPVFVPRPGRCQAHCHGVRKDGCVMCRGVVQRDGLTIPVAGLVKSALVW